MAEIEGVAVGRIVHYVPEDGRANGECRAGVIVRVFDGSGGSVNLTVFGDWGNDGGSYTDGLVWKRSRPYDANRVPGSWHWPERV